MVGEPFPKDVAGFVSRRDPIDWTHTSLQGDVRKCEKRGPVDLGLSALNRVRLAFSRLKDETDKPEAWVPF